MTVLSLFPGIGLLDLAFEIEGYCVVRGPDVLWGGDIRRFHPPTGVFAGVIGGPPCQTFSSLAHLVRANGYEPRFGNLIPEFERCVTEAQPAWFLMENVPAAPEPVVSGYGVRSFLLDNSALDAGDGFGHEQRRVRRFSFGVRGGEAPDLRRWINLATFLLPDAQPVVVSSGQPDSREQEKRRGSTKQRHECINGSHGKPPSVRDKVRSGHGTAAHDSMENVTEWSRSRKAGVTSNVGGRGSDAKPQAGKAAGGKGRYRLADALRLQGLPEDFLDHCPFTADGKLKAVANGVPIMMGRALAGAVKEATA